MNHHYGEQADDDCDNMDNGHVVKESRYVLRSLRLSKEPITVVARYDF